MEHRAFKKNIIAAIISSLGVSSTYAAVEAESTEPIEKITVYGEKIERSLKDTTSSVSVIDKDSLDSGQYQSVSDALSEIPNVVVLTGSVPDIRGVSGNGSASGFNSFTGGARARVSTLVDGVAEPFVADLTGDTGLWDIQQVEVFRGPQSTINGRNSIGGTVFIKTEDPTFDWRGAARLGYRDQNNYVDSAVMVSGPILDDELAFRLSGQNVTGETYNKGLVYETNPAPFDLNELITNRWRGKFLWQPSAIEELKVLYSFSYNDEKGDSGRNYFSGDDPWAYRPILQRYIETESTTHSVKVDYDLGSGRALDLVVAYMDYDWGSKSYEALVTAQQYVDMKDESYTVDGKYSFGLNDRDFNGFIGLAYYERSQDFGSTGSSVYTGDDSSSSLSIYGELTYGLAESLWLTVGGRVMRDEQKRNFSMLYRGTQLEEKLDNDSTITLPKLVLQYAITDNTTLAASARRGYNSGGGALSLAESEYYYYDEEFVDTYELSARSMFLGGNVNLSANLFYNDFDGYQASNQARKITNVDKAVTYGIETELSAMLTANWQVITGVGLLDSEIKKVDSSYGDIVGNQLNSAPHVTANLGVKYWLNDAFSVGVSGNYVGEYFADIDNTESRIAGDYVVARLSVDYQKDNWRISGFINNMFDEQAMTVNEPPSANYVNGYAAIIDPRNLGVSVMYSF
ncbi:MULTISPECIES: TonB-dependent receptor [Shewanella]|uniref:TonB-dependent receptor n=2 Tax=Shewanella putrefaciens TaxID=24 RepID=A0ABX8XB14_SHEPU|nr:MULTISPECIES: TonB-dependent receptor [Shewanella]MCK7630971.1 TonB-dependent receptor [Shewanella sp. JNE9-1]MCK7633943.1 TonB-dependent receptor [Shewanella sp. JNE17]MCK7646224.1 TonB-dependent receptor [Shewanella sp. JNE3-1]MCK7649168.1 TonB-dependent receptor [Shewanella sp. JNE8]MCK7654179.1 TonB-dependent receptor [Shewanella sp. JNE4-1]